MQCNGTLCQCFLSVYGAVNFEMLTKPALFQCGYMDSQIVAYSYVNVLLGCAYYLSNYLLF